MPAESPHIFGLAAEFLTPEELVRAATRVSAAGYCRTDALTPYPVEGLPASVGGHRTGIPPVCLAGGIGGAGLAYAMCWYANVIGYTWDVGNRPLNSWPAFLSVTADVAIGGAFFAALGLMLVLNGLPRWNHPLFNVEAIGRATLDRFFLVIERSDPQFDARQTRDFLNTLLPAAVYTVPA